MRQLDSAASVMRTMSKTAHGRLALAVIGDDDTAPRGDSLVRVYEQAGRDVSRAARVIVGEYGSPMAMRAGGWA